MQSRSGGLLRRFSNCLSNVLIVRLMSLVSLCLYLTDRRFYLDSAQNRQLKLISYRVAQQRLT